MKAMRASRRHTATKGFNLIEAAIVLGIVGLVVGGIWVAATSVYSNLRSKRATDVLLTVVQGTRALFATSAVTGLANGGALTATLAQSNVLPSDALGDLPNNTTAANTVNPWGGNIAIFAAPNSNGTGDSGFVIQFTNIPSAACVNFVSRNTGTGRDAGMYNTIGAAGGAAAYVAPVAANNLTPNQALALVTITGANHCNSVAAPSNRNYSFFFNLRG